jgi:hypothetical protein
MTAQIQAEVLLIVAPGSVVVGYQHFGRPYCLHLVVVLWVVAPSSVVVGYQHFGGPYCLHLAVVLWVVMLCSVVGHTEIGAVLTSETLVFYHNTTRHHSTGDLDLNAEVVFCRFQVKGIYTTKHCWPLAFLRFRINF